MAVDQTLLGVLDAAAARGIAATAVFAEQHSNMIVAAAQNDSRMMNGFLASQLFNQELVQAKAAYHSPVEPSAAPLPSAPAKA